MIEPPELVEDESPEERAFDYGRTVALSDGVFAIALTLLVLNLTVPNLPAGHADELGARLLDRTGEFTSYAISFAVIALLWVRHHVLFRSLATIDGRMTVLNLASLGFIALLPYPTRVLSRYDNRPASIILYAATITIVAVLAALMRIHAQRNRLLTEQGARRLAAREHWAIAPAVFLTSMPIAFVSPTAAKLLWAVLLLPAVQRTRGRQRGFS